MEKAVSHLPTDQRLPRLRRAIDKLFRDDEESQACQPDIVIN